MAAVDAVDLAAEETPPPRKRLRAEEPPKEVLSLVDSDDDVGSPAPAARDVGAARVERHAGRLWGALGGHAGAAGDGAAAATRAAAAAAAAHAATAAVAAAAAAADPVDGLGSLGRPMYRPPSARFRRPGAAAAAAAAGLAGAGQRGDKAATSGPWSVIEVADDDDDIGQQAHAAEARPQAALLGRLTRRRYGVLDNATGAEGDEADSGPAAAGGGASPQQEQQPHPHPRPRQRLLLPRPRDARGAAGMDAGDALEAGAGGIVGAAAAAAAAAAGPPPWGMRFHALDLGPEDAAGRPQRPRHTPHLTGGLGAAGGGAAAAGGDAAGAGQEGGDAIDMPLRARVALRQAAVRPAAQQAAAAQPHGGGAGGAGGSSDPMSAWGRLTQRSLQVPLRFLEGVRARRTGAPGERGAAARAEGGGAGGSGSALAAGPGAKQEEEDMLLAARLQAEEDERVARETARRMEQEEHRRMMALAPPERGQAQGAGGHTAGGRADGYSPAAAALAMEAAMLRSQLAWQSARTNQHVGSALPYQHIPYAAPAVPAAAAPAPPLFAAPAAGPGARSRLDAYEALEEHTQAAARRGRTQAALAALEQRERSAAAAAAAGAAAAAAAAAGGGGGRSNAERLRREQELYGRGARARGARNGGGEMGDSGAPGDAGAGGGAAAGAGAGPMGLGLGLPAGFPGLFMLGGAGGGAGRGAGGGGGGGQAAPRYSSRALHELLPMMALGLHRGFMGAPDDDDDDDDDGPGVNPFQAPHPGHPGAYRRGRHAAAYREQARAMREQMVAAQRAGIPAHLLLSDRDFTPEDYEMLCRLDERVENRKGAKDDQLATLPTEVLTADNPRRRSDGATATCAICMEDLAPGDTVKRMPCAHEFHDNCIDQWLRTKACCPICQRGLDD